MIDFGMTAVVSLLFVVDPVGALPAYLAMTEDDGAEKRRRTAWKASVTATVALAAFALAGPVLFDLLGLTMAAFQIAGGLILFLMAVDTIRAKRYTQERPDSPTPPTARTLSLTGSCAAKSCPPTRPAALCAK